jgi:hypothetical protein
MKNNPLAKFAKSILLSTLILLSLYSFGQKRNGYLGLDAGIYAVDQYSPGVGVHVSGNAGIANEVFVGAEIGAVKFNHLDKVYAPLLARFSFMPELSSRRANLLILIAPGYGIYDDSRWRNNIYYKSKGGFAFYGGVGAAFRGTGRGYLTITVGYSTFGFTGYNYKSNIDGVGIRIGALFR